MSKYIELVDIHKIYPDGTVALRGVNLEINRGEVLALLGENGAGKTTLMKILSGYIRQTSGEILIEGRPVKFKSTRDAIKRGIVMVHQTFSLVPNMTVLENIILGREKTSSSLTDLLKPIDIKQATSEVLRISSELGLKVPLNVPVENLPLGYRQRVEILKALYKGAKLLILDEPTTFLSPIEVEELTEFIRKFKEAGNTVIFVTHKIKEALRVADRIVVLRRGKVVGEFKAHEADPRELAVFMVGREINLDVVLRRNTPLVAEKPVLVVRDLWVRNDLGELAVKGVNFEVYPGEVFGIAGVEGNGQDELVEALTGLRKIEKGRILVNNVEVESPDPVRMYKLGVSHIPGDREKYGLILSFTVQENCLLSRQWEPEFTRNEVVLSWSKVRDYALRIISKFNVVTPGVQAPVRVLSGGNRQRLLVGRELTKNSRLIIAVHPTKGLDVASTLYVRENLARERDAGKAILLVSADLEEILQLSDRVAVMYEGRFLAVRKTEEYTLEELGLLMGGIEPEKVQYSR
ncbi:MAG: ABC transporter ATP-binding protein [Thermofilaceae archaeon]